MNHEKVTTMNATLDKWPNGFTRLAELTGEMPRQAYGGWFEGIARHIQEVPLAWEAHEQLEKHLGVLPQPVWTEFKNKLLRQTKSSRRELISLLNEAEGFAVLQRGLSERGITFDEIRQPVPTGKKGRREKAPEWVAMANGQVVAAIEVKTAFGSDAQRDYVEENTRRLKNKELPLVQTLSYDIPGGLLNKLDEQIGNAKKQLASLDFSPRLLIVFMIVNVDIGAAHHPDCRQILTRHLQRHSDEQVTVESDLRSAFLN